MFCIQCKDNQCSLGDLSKITWKEYNSILSYSICNSSSTSLKERDSIEIEYLGILKNNENILIQSERDMLFCSKALGIQFGRHLLRDESIAPSFNQIIKHLTKNSEALIKCNFGEEVLSTEFKISIFLKAEHDSAEAMSHVSSIFSNFSSKTIKYISKKEAIQKFSSDLNDSSWTNFLTENPLPSSIDVTISSSEYTVQTEEYLKNSFQKLSFVSEVILPTNTDLQFLTPSKNPYFIRIRS